MTPKDIHEDTVQILAEDTSSSATVKKWVVEFKRDWNSTEDNLLSVSPITPITDEQVDEIHHSFGCQTSIFSADS